jgi:thiamine biosynthesis protein ThiC
MQNHKKQDNISVNIINQENQIRHVPQNPAGNADKDPFCVYDHKRHAVGSKIINEDGSESICTKDGLWKNT